MSAVSNSGNDTATRVSGICTLERYRGGGMIGDASNYFADRKIGDELVGTISAPERMLEFGKLPKNSRIVRGLRVSGDKRCGHMKARAGGARTDPGGETQQRIRIRQLKVTEKNEAVQKPHLEYKYGDALYSEEMLDGKRFKAGVDLSESHLAHIDLKQLELTLDRKMCSADPDKPVPRHASYSVIDRVIAVFNRKPKSATSESVGLNRLAENLQLHQEQLDRKSDGSALLLGEASMKQRATGMSSWLACLPGFPWLGKRRSAELSGSADRQPRFIGRSLSRSSESSVASDENMDIVKLVRYVKHYDAAKNDHVFERPKVASEAVNSRSSANSDAGSSDSVSSGTWHEEDGFEWRCDGEEVVLDREHWPCLRASDNDGDERGAGGADGLRPQAGSARESRSAPAYVNPNRRLKMASNSRPEIAPRAAHVSVSNFKPLAAVRGRPPMGNGISPAYGKVAEQTTGQSAAASRANRLEGNSARWGTPTPQRSSSLQPTVSTDLHTDVPGVNAAIDSTATLSVRQLREMFEAKMKAHVSSQSLQVLLRQKSSEGAMLSRSKSAEEPSVEAQERGKKNNAKRLSDELLQRIARAQARIVR